MHTKTFALISLVIAVSAEEIDLSKLPPSAERKVDFIKEIKPLFEQSCFGCHGAKPRAKSKYFMNHREGTIQGGSSKEAAIVVGKSAESPLVHFVSDLIEDLEMPPIDKRDKYPMLTKKQIGLIRAWIDQGASWPKNVELTLPQ